MDPANIIAIGIAIMIFGLTGVTLLAIRADVAEALADLRADDTKPLLDAIGTVATTQSVHSEAIRRIGQGVEKIDGVIAQVAVLASAVNQLIETNALPPSPSPEVGTVAIIEALGRVLNPAPVVYEQPATDPNIEPPIPWQPGMPIPADDLDDPMADGVLSLAWLDQAATDAGRSPVEHARDGERGGFVTAWGPDGDEPPAHP